MSHRWRVGALVVAIVVLGLVAASWAYPPSSESELDAYFADRAIPVKAVRCQNLHYDSDPTFHTCTILTKSPTRLGRYAVRPGRSEFCFSIPRSWLPFGDAPYPVAPDEVSECIGRALDG